jgi:hypothetical protein
MDQIMYPQTLYHGTIDLNLDSFRTRLLDRTYWKPKRDFGAGFYTTTSIIQAKKWARDTAKKYTGPETPRPCVLEIEFNAERTAFEPLVYISETVYWAKFVLDHRTKTERDYDPCPVHPDLVIGPVADNDTGKIVEAAIKLNKTDDPNWFFNQIVRSRHGRRRDTTGLGNQVVFSKEGLERMLRLTGYYTFFGSRWQYDVEGSDPAGSL